MQRSPFGQRLEPRSFDLERYPPVTIEAMLRLQDGPTRSFMIASAIGQFLHEDGSSDRLRSGRDAAGSLITQKRLPLVLEALGITDRHWRRLTADWEARYIAHRCGSGRVFLFTRPLLPECPACHAEIPVTKAAPSPSTRRGNQRDQNGRWRSAETDPTCPPDGRNRSAEVDATRPRPGTPAPHHTDGSLTRGEVGLQGELVLKDSEEGSSRTRRDRFVEARDG